MGLESPNSIVPERLDNPLSPSAWISLASLLFYTLFFVSHWKSKKENDFSIFYTNFKPGESNEKLRTYQ